MIFTMLYREVQAFNSNQWNFPPSPTSGEIIDIIDEKLVFLDQKDFDYYLTIPISAHIISHIKIVDMRRI